MQDNHPTPFDIIASLDKRRREYRNIGWVYIMRNAAFRESLLKIGKTQRPPPYRAYELGSTTAAPEDFQIVYCVHVGDCHGAESQVHAELARYRKSPNKEFFLTPISEAIEALDRVAARFPVIVGRGQHARILEQLFQVYTVRCQACATDNRVRQLAVRVIPKCRSCGAGLLPES